MHFVKEASYYKNYSLLLKFKNWKSKIFDMSPFLENKSLIFRPLKQKDIFKMFEVKNNTVTWITGADISPDYLYEKWIDV